MKEIIIKFETEEDYAKFITEVCMPTVVDGKAEFDEFNNILIVKNNEKN